MDRITTLCCAALFAALLTAPAADNADQLQAPFTKVFADRQDNTVRLAVTRKLADEDQTFEIPATSIDGKGLLITSLSAIESGSAHMQALSAENKSKLTRVALLRPDATEAEADLVVTDAALDLALIRVRPVKDQAATIAPAPPMAKAAPALLENLLAIQRTGQQFQRIAAVACLQVAAVTTIPRNFYIPSSPQPGGTAIYNLAGELLGITATVHNECVIVPVDAILKVAAKAEPK